MMLVMYVIMKCHPVRGCIKVGNFILLHYHWMKSIAKQSTNKHYSSMQRTKEYMFVVNLEFFMFVSHQRYTWNLKIDGGIQSPLLTFKCLQKKNLWLDLFFHFCFRRTVVKFFENRLLHWVNVTKTRKKTVCYSTLFIILLRPKHTVVSCSNSIPLMQDMLGIRWHVKIEIDLTCYARWDVRFVLRFASGTTTRDRESRGVFKMTSQ